MKKEILHIAVEKLNDLFGIQCEILDEEVRIGKRQIDAQILLVNGQNKTTFNVEIKTKIVPAQIPRIKEQLDGLEPFLIIADYITTKAKELMKNENMPYVDTAGNMFIPGKDLFIYVQTNKTNREKLRTGNRAFNKAGLKVVYQFLIHPEYLNKPYRFIGEGATVTIDTVRRVIQGLLKDKYIIQSEVKKYRFTDRKKLFHEWATEFNKNLRPKLKQRKYAWLKKGTNWKKVKLPQNTYWGGAAAAENLTDYLIADTAIIYTGLPFTEIMKPLEIIPDENGTITLIEKFWKDEQDNKFVHPMLTYVDLLDYTNPRYIETANKIFKEYVEDKL